MDPTQQQQFYQQQQETVDASHLRLLSIFHYVWGGLGILISIFLVSYIFLMRFIMEQAAASGSSGSGDVEQMKAMMGIIGVMYAAMGVFGVIISICNFFAGKFIAKRKNKMFIFIMSGLNCLSVPLGTTLGVFTFIVLMRPSIGATFDTGKEY